MAFTKATSLALLALSILTGYTSAAPLEVLKRDATISPSIFDNLSFFSQYSAAAYCRANNNSTGTQLSCKENNCARIQAADTNTLAEFEDSLDTDTTGFVSTDQTNKLIVIAFRGSSSVDNWLTNLQFDMEDVPIFCPGCKAHRGFLKAWNEVQAGIIPSVQAAMAEFPDFHLVITGHSLGGALATIGAAALRRIDIPVDLYTYGAPKSGNKAWATYLSKTDKGQAFRVVHKEDIVPSLPPSIPILMEYAHVQPEYLITSGNLVDVTIQDVKVRADGNSAGTDIAAHLWYFNHISAC